MMKSSDNPISSKLNLSKKSNSMYLYSMHYQHIQLFNFLPEWLNF